jgi:serine/threonine protein kinase
MKDPMLGQQLANFRVERLIGQGGMASVYLGVDVKLKRPVAIKVIDRRYRDNPAYVTRFINEARMMAQWRHENLIQIYYADETQGFSYYVMEYVDGDDLATVMAAYSEENAQMPNDDVLRIGRAVANALDYAHRRGVIHRDVKPSNVLIAKDGRVLLGDFGMALEVRDGSMGNVFGTPHYISPEQARRSADAVPQSDLYSLGIILYEALTGTVPFEDSSPASIALQHITQDPPPPSKYNTEVTPAVEAVILRALEKKPQDRYRTGADLMSALEQAFNAVESPSKMSLPPLPVGVPTIRHPRVPINEMTRHLKKKGDTIYKPLDDVSASNLDAEKESKRKKLWILIPLLLLLLGLGGWLCASSGFFSTGFGQPSIFTSSPTETAPHSVQPTHTLVQPSATAVEVIPSLTATQMATMTATSTVTFTPSPTPSLAALIPSPVDGAATPKYADGINLTLFWNETSFYMLNRTRTERSLSGFTFERLDENSQPTDTFPGYRWETYKFNYIPAKTCVSIKIYKDEDPPYLDPADCRSYSSILQPDQSKEPALFFWNPKEGSSQFRVLWLKEEIARCEIGLGICEIFIP